MVKKIKKWSAAGFKGWGRGAEGREQGTCGWGPATSTETSLRCSEEQHHIIPVLSEFAQARGAPAAVAPAAARLEERPLYLNRCEEDLLRGNTDASHHTAFLRCTCQWHPCMAAGY